MATLTARTATIFIASGEQTKVYRSVDDVPPELRRKLMETTNGKNSATIIIADKRGHEELLLALRGGKSDVRCHRVDSVPSKQSPLGSRVLASLCSPRAWLEFLLPVIIGASLWLLVDSHF
ncbi:MAG: hypothetical protein M3Y72_21275 [Acidobacteriota bacterium]|nr:hypothetical protein [Acidobacteriota bacterium]